MSLKLSQITSGGALSPSTDQIVTVRSGSTDVLTTPGTAAAKTASNAALTNVASVSGSVTVGHVASFADTAGTVQDGGVLGTAAAATASSATGTVAAVNGGTTSGHVATFIDSAGTIHDGGVLGTAAAAAASSATGTVAAVTGTITAGHIAVFSNTTGTIQDGGAPVSSGMTPTFNAGVPTATPAFGTGQITFDTTDDNRAYVWNGTKWQYANATSFTGNAQASSWGFDKYGVFGKTLSNSNQTVSVATGNADYAYNLCLCTPGKKAGKRYFEFTSSTSTTNAAFGLFPVNAGVPLSGPFPGNPPSIYWGPGGAVDITGNSTIGTAQTWSTGTNLSCAVDFGAQLIWFRNGNGNWNNNSSANPATGAGGFSIAGCLPGDYVPFCVAPSPGSGGPYSQTINLGTASFVNSVPSGFTGWIV